MAIVATVISSRDGFQGKPRNSKARKIKYLYIYIYMYSKEYDVERINNDVKQKQVDEFLFVLSLRNRKELVFGLLFV